MTEIEKTEGEIKVLQAKLELLKEMENHKSPAEEAYKRVYNYSPPTSPYVSNFEDTRWRAFELGYRASQEDYKVGEYQPSPQTPEQVADGLRDAMRQAKEEGVFDDLMERKTEPPEPTSTVFRQKLFDGIKSVFYDPDYERTHWKMKVDMAVDEVLTHFYDVIPDKEYHSNTTYDMGYNDCIDAIKGEMEMEE
jgi:hypothetical protein